MSPAPDPIRVLFLGCGRATRIHSRVLRRRDVELFYASRDFDRAVAFRRRFGGRRAYGSYEDALADPRVDVALVATPPRFHREHALLALAAGKHVVVEKPAFMSTAEADAVADAALAADRKVLVAENYAYKPVARHIRTRVLGGDLGEVRFVSIDATKRQDAPDWRGDPSLSGGGALFEAGVHWVSFAASLGLAVLDVTAHQAGPGVAGADRSSLVVLRYAGGAVGTIAHSWELPAPLGGARLSRLQGTRGAVTFESNGFLALTTGRRRSLRLFAHDALGYGAMHDDFLSALRGGREPFFTLAHARRDLALLGRAEASMREGSCGLATATAFYHRERSITKGENSINQGAVG